MRIRLQESHSFTSWEMDQLTPLLSREDVTLKELCDLSMPLVMVDFNEQTQGLLICHAYEY